MLDSTGEQLGFLKPRAVDGKRMEFHVKAREAFQGWAVGRISGTNLGFWRPCEASELTWSILEHVPLPKGGALKPYLKALTPDLQKAVMALPSLVQALERAGLVEVSFRLPVGEAKRHKETRATKVSSYHQIVLWVQCRRGYLTTISQSISLFCRGICFSFSLSCRGGVYEYVVDLVKIAVK